MSLATAPVIEFNEAEHTYTLDGQPVPSVTKVLEPMYDFRFVDPEALERSRDLGTKVHKTIEMFELGTLKRRSLHVTLDKYLQQYERFKDDFCYLSVAQEVRVASRKWRVAGTLDNHGLLLPRIDGDKEEPLLLDVKTGEEYAAHVLQTGGYKVCAVEMGLLPDSTKRASLYLDEDGYRLRWHRDETMDKLAFCSLINIAHWRRHHG